MTFAEYIKLKERVQELPCETQETFQPLLSHLLHLIQCENVADTYYKKYKAEMKEWQKNVAADIEKYLKELEVQNG